VVAAQPAPAFGRAHHPKKYVVVASATPVAWNWADIDSVAWNLTNEKATAAWCRFEQLLDAGQVDALLADACVGCIQLCMYD
jgi:hypothetical protein